MNRFQRNTLFGLLVILLIGTVWYAATRPQAPTETDSPAPSAAQMSEETEKHLITVSYPSSTSLADEANAAAVARMKAWVEETVTEFKAGSGTAEERPYALDIAYLASSSPRTLSYLFTVYVDTGGAHPNGYFKTFTFDTETGAYLALADLFTPGAPYLARLSEISREKLPETIGEYADREYIASGTTATEENFSTFFFDQDHLVLLFSPYQVGPWALGPVTLRIPAAELSDILKPQYP